MIGSERLGGNLACPSWIRPTDDADDCIIVCTYSWAVASGSAARQALNAATTRMLGTFIHADTPLSLHRPPFEVSVFSSRRKKYPNAALRESPRRRN